MTEGISSTIVYNRLNHEAVLAAAILASKLENTKCVDIAQRIDDDSDQYIWIGIEPVPGIGSFHETINNKTHVVIVNGLHSINAVTKVKKAFMIFGRYTSEEKHISEEEMCDVGVRRTLIDRACEYFNIQESDFDRLAFHASKFHDRKAELEYLAFVHKNVKQAERCLIAGEHFQVMYPNQGDVESYLSEMSRIKKSFSTGYQEITVLDGDRTRSALYTTISDSSYHLALRLIKLSHVNYLNLSMGLCGPIAFSNMKRLKFTQDQQQPILLN